MKYKEVEISGSANSPYTITFEQKGDRVLMTCNCKAGQFGKLCKHKVQAVKDELATSSDFCIPLQNANYKDVINEIEKIESELIALKKDLDKKKKSLIKMMS